jgi:hypothetical protein
MIFLYAVMLAIAISFPMAADIPQPLALPDAMRREASGDGDPDIAEEDLRIVIAPRPAGGRMVRDNNGKSAKGAS